MKIKYNTQTGEILCMGALPNLQAGQNEAVSDVSFVIPSDSLNYYTFNGSALVRKEQGAIDTIVSESGFNVDLMTKRIGDVIEDAKEIALMPYLGGIQSSAKAKNWVKLKSLINGLGQAQIATSDEVTAIKGVIAEQGINIDSY